VFDIGRMTDGNEAIKPEIEKMMKTVDDSYEKMQKLRGSPPYADDAYTIIEVYIHILHIFFRLYYE